MEDVTDVVFRHVISEAANPTYSLQNLQTRKVIATLKEELVYGGV